MNAIHFFSSRCPHTTRFALVIVSGLFAVILLAGTLTVHAQAPQPSATPAGSPDPSATPPANGNSGLYLPQAATVQVGTTPSTTQQNSVTRSGVSRTSVPTTSDTSPASPQPLQISSPGLFAPTSLAAQPQAATITLSYNAACAGANVSVAPLDGGTINGSAGAKTVTVGTDGTLVFTFQAPSGPGRYHVVTRLNGSEIALPFDVADPVAATPTGN